MLFHRQVIDGMAVATAVFVGMHKGFVYNGYAMRRSSLGEGRFLCMQ